MRTTILLWSVLILVFPFVEIEATGQCEEGWKHVQDHCEKVISPEEECEGDEELVGEELYRDGKKAMDLKERKCIKYLKDTDPNLYDVGFNPNETMPKPDL